MQLKITILVIMLGILFLFPERVQAGQNGHLHYYSPDGKGGLVWVEEEMGPDERAAAEERAFILFQAFFEGEHVGFVPDGVRLLNVQSKNGVLYVDVSREILAYGGSYYERCLISQIVRTALDMDGVDSVTLLIEGEVCALAEGSFIDGESKWTDMAGHDG